MIVNAVRSTEMISSVETDTPSEERTKSAKTKHSSDVHHRQSGRHALEGQRAVSAESTSIYRHVMPLTNESRNEERVNEYVQSQSLINNPFPVQTGEQEPWTAFTTRDPVNTPVPSYITSSDIAHPVPSPQAPLYGFQPDFTFYEGPWNTGNPPQDHTSSFSPPE
jgi:hypothetical protein